MAFKAVKNSAPPHAEQVAAIVEYQYSVEASWEDALALPGARLSVLQHDGMDESRLTGPGLREADRHGRIWARLVHDLLVAAFMSDALPGEAPTFAQVLRLKEDRRAVMALRNKIVLANMGLAVQAAAKAVSGIARRNARVDHSLHDDMRQQAQLGLMRAIDLFDASLGLRFSTYAVPWIRCFTSIETGRLSIIRIPDKVRTLINRIDRTTVEYLAEHGRHPTIYDLAKILDVKAGKIDAAMMAPRLVDGSRFSRTHVKGRAVLSFEEAEPDMGRIHTARATVGDDLDTPEQRVSQAQSMGYLDGLLARLSPMEREIVRRRFGFEGTSDVTADADHQTLDEVSQAVQLSRERVRQLEKQGIEKMRRWAELKGIL